MRRESDLIHDLLQVEPWIRPSRTFRDRVRRKLGAKLVDGFFAGASYAGKSVPVAHPRLHGFDLIRDVQYRGSGLPEHRLDVYQPRGWSGPRPAVLYVHGGACRALSKETHWIFGLLFARAGYTVFNINYRLSPAHPFPAPLADVCAAYEWVVGNAARFGADPARLVLAGESAGGNLITSAAMAACYRRPESYARGVYETGVVPKAVLPACGVLQVSDPERFARKQPLSKFIDERLTEVADHYFHGMGKRAPMNLDLADPLLALERGDRPDRPLPPFLACAGTADPLLDDTLRLKAALDKLGVDCEAPVYEGEVHAFHAFIFRSASRKYWRHAYDFLRRKGCAP